MPWQPPVKLERWCDEQEFLVLGDPRVHKWRHPGSKADTPRGFGRSCGGACKKTRSSVSTTWRISVWRWRMHPRLWRETFDRPLDDIFAVQDEVTANVISALRVTLLGERPQLRETDPEAYTLFLQARHIGNLLSQQNLETIIPMFECVLETDPTYAPAYIELASAYGNQAALGLQPVEVSIQMRLEACCRS